MLDGEELLLGFVLAFFKPGRGLGLDELFYFYELAGFLELFLRIYEGWGWIFHVLNYRA